MEDFIKNIIGLAELGIWMFILFGAVCAVFVFGILMMIIKKKAFPVGTSTAVATLLAAIALPLIGQVASDYNYIYFNLFIIGSGAILSVVGGVISMIVSRRCKRKECREPAYKAPAAEQVTDFFSEPAPFDYTSDNAYAPPAPKPSPDYGTPPSASPYAGGYAAPVSTASPEVDALLMKINRICANGAPLTEMRETAMQLQKERAKPENKNNPETYSRLNKALIDLLGVIQKR